MRTIFIQVHEAACGFLQYQEFTAGDVIFKQVGLPFCSAVMVSLCRSWSRYAVPTLQDVLLGLCLNRAPRPFSTCSREAKPHVHRAPLSLSATSPLPLTSPSVLV